MSSFGRVVKKLSNVRGLGLIWLLAACATSGPVETTQDESHYEIVAQPKEFKSPLDEIEEVRKQVTQSEQSIFGRKKVTTKKWYEHASSAQTWDELEAEQSDLEGQIAATGEVELYPGRSYSFDFESYCVNAGQARPATGDELKIAPLHGLAEKWLPKILDEQGKFGSSQSQVQYLIWALLYDTRFDELSDENQRVLLQFYPDAAVRFGNRRLEGSAKSLIWEMLPTEVTDAADQITEYRSRVLNLQSDYRELERTLAPPADHNQPIPVGWMKMPDGYLIRLTSDSYTMVRVDLYVPRGELGRSPQAIQRPIIFRPSRWIGLPAKGQRLAISSKAVSREKRKTDDECKKLSEWRPSHCHGLTDRDRDKIVALANPKNFPDTWYQSPPKAGFSIKDRIDCSNFVNEIFSQAGFPFEYSPTKSFHCLNVFEEVPEGYAKAGDLILFRTHIGIIDHMGNVVSATKGGPKLLSFLKRGESPEGHPKVSAIQSLPRDKVVGNEHGSVMRWRCP